jgi:hypothetical protein
VASKLTREATELVTERGDGLGPLRYMTSADGWVMARRPGCVPFVEPLSDWLKRPLESTAAEHRAQYRETMSAINGGRL